MVGHDTMQANVVLERELWVLHPNQEATAGETGRLCVLLHSSMMSEEEPPKEDIAGNVQV